MSSSPAPSDRHEDAAATTEDRCPSCGGDEGDNWFDRSICPEPCGSMHTRCANCGHPFGGCPLEDGSDVFAGASGKSEVGPVGNDGRASDPTAASRRLCAGCSRPFEVGDRYIVDSSSGFANNDADPVVDDLIAGIFGGSDSKLWICEDCTEPGEGYRSETYYGEDE